MKKVKTIFFIFILSFWGSQIIIAQNVKIYAPEADVSMAISQGLIKAKAENKHLLLQIGGNWCPWCLKFHKFCSDDQEISLFISKNYIKILVNYSKENHNLAELKKLEYPQRFGFPVFVILDQDGKRLHTQNSSYLEEGDGYSKKKVLDFLTQWSPEALNPNLYLEK
jgi:thioredoxin-related protein